MNVRLSRHAKRRAKLYKIREELICKILDEIDIADGYQEIITEVREFDYPIKIVIMSAKGEITVITAYPMKRGRANESSL